jgi:hypothetical protein
MANQQERLQRVWHMYEETQGRSATSLREVVSWAVDNGHLERPEIDPLDKLVRDMSKALREEHAVDPSTGRTYRVNHAVRISRNGVQLSLWSSMHQATYDHMTKAFSQRRRLITGDCLQLKTDVDVYNGRFRKAEDAQIPLALDFTEDVAEAEALGIPPEPRNDDEEENDDSAAS